MVLSFRSIDTKRAIALSASALALPLLFTVSVNTLVTRQPLLELRPAHFQIQQPATAIVISAPIMPDVAEVATATVAQPTKMPRIQKRQDDKNDKKDADKSSSSSSKSKSSSSSSSQKAASTPTDSKGASAPTATSADGKTLLVKQCAWSRKIEGTSTMPLWLTLGLSAGDIAGVILASFTAYQYGKAASHSGGGGMGMAPGGAPPPMY